MGFSSLSVLFLCTYFDDRFSFVSIGAGIVILLLTLAIGKLRERVTPFFIAAALILSGVSFEVLSDYKISYADSLTDKESVIEATVLDEPEFKNSRYYYTVKTEKIDGVNFEVKLRLSASQFIDTEPYDKIKLKVNLYEIGSFSRDIKLYYHSKGIFLGGYVSNYDGVLVEVSPDTETFQPKLAEFEEKITAKTKAVIVNTPNNPTGVVYSEETIEKMAEILEKKQKEFGTDIYLISDEPYRELAYDGVEVPYLTKYYANTIVGYSYSKSLSLPGERIGYLVIPSEASDSEDLISAASVATRILGFVNAPTLQQKVVKACLNAKTDISYYDRNREALYNGLKELGFECVRPEGAFYLFVKSPVEDEKAFCAAAKKYNILIVPGSSFGCPGYVRIAYCVAYETIVNSLPKFKELAGEYK